MALHHEDEVSIPVYWEQESPGACVTAESTKKMGCYQILMLIAMGLELLMLGGILTLEILTYREHHLPQFKNLEMPAYDIHSNHKCGIWNMFDKQWVVGGCGGSTTYNQLVELH